MSATALEKSRDFGFARPIGHGEKDVGTDYPSDWKEATLEMLSAFITKGSTPTTYGFRWERDGVLFLRSECVSLYGLDLGESMFISEKAHSYLKRSEVADGDILITITGNVGRVVHLSEVGRANINQHIARIRIISSDAAPSFVYHFLSQPKIRAYYENITTGQAYPQISLKQVRATIVPLPSRKEQSAIAKALDDADALIESLEQLIAKKRAVKQGAMQDLLSGRRRLPGFGAEWQEVKFGAFASLRKERIDPRVAGRQPFCVELEHVGQGTGRLEGFSEAGENSSLKAVFKEGDVLFGKLRAYLRKYWLADREGVCSTEFWVLIPQGGKVTSTYLYQLVQTDAFVEVASLGYGTHMPRSDWSSVNEIEFSIPQIDEQEAIGRVLGDMDAELDALELRLQKARQIKQGMMQELLTGRVRLV